MLQKPSIPKGMRDFGPSEMARRNMIFRTISEVYGMYGYHQIETPTMEMLSVLMGKYGEEGDRLLFKILNSGEVLSGIDLNEAVADTPASFAAKVCEKGLRYDLTVPFARYVVMHRNDITFPFKRYQIQPVWRADRPQKGRYREFYQCDADVIGSDSLLNEAELIAIVDEVFRRLGVRVRMHLNNRKILSGIVEIIGESDRLVDFTVAIDKIDKIGMAGVSAELESKGFSKEVITRVEPLLRTTGTNEEKLDKLAVVFAESTIGMEGVDEVRQVLKYVDALSLRWAELFFDISLARGLSYYTGAIIEAKALDVPMGSILGGGRYDNLTGIFGLPGVSGVGISFGADRIYDVMTELDLFATQDLKVADLLFVNFGEEYITKILPVVSEVRRAGVNVEYYPDAAKLKKQFSYADSYQIPYVAVMGEEEAIGGFVTLKNMAARTQENIPIAEFTGHILELIGSIK